MVQRIVDKVSLGVDCRVVHGVEVSVFNSPVIVQLPIDSFMQVLNRASDLLATDWLSQITNEKICGNFSCVAQMWFLSVLKILINHFNKFV